MCCGTLARMTLVLTVLAGWTLLSIVALPVCAALLHGARHGRRRAAAGSGGRVVTAAVRCAGADHVLPEEGDDVRTTTASRDTALPALDGLLPAPRSASDVPAQEAARR